MTSITTSFASLRRKGTDRCVTDCSVANVPSPSSRKHVCHSAGRNSTRPPRAAPPSTPVPPPSYLRPAASAAAAAAAAVGAGGGADEGGAADKEWAATFASS